MKLGILTPIRQDLPYESFKSFVQLIVNKPVDKIELFVAKSTMVSHGRNLVADMFLDEKYKDFDYLLWIDSDMVFTLDDVEKLLEHKDKDIVCAMAKARGNKNYNIFVKTGYDNRPLQPMEAKYEGLVEIDDTGLCFMLMKREVIERFMKQGGFSVVGNQSEDFAFCDWATSNGYKIYCDTDIIVGHCVLSVLY